MEREPADGCDALEACPRTLGDGAEAAQRFMDGSGAAAKDDFSSNEDLSSLRCSSMPVESCRRKREPTAGYPGLAFGSPMYSNTLFKFSLIANEIKDLKQNQLKKVSGSRRPTGTWSVSLVHRKLPLLRS